MLEENDVLGGKTKVGVLLEEILGFASRWAAGHDIPGDDDRASCLAIFACSNDLEAGDSLCLVLEEGFVGWQSDIVATLGSAAT